jgi:hypothetical protein
MDKSKDKDFLVYAKNKLPQKRLRSARRKAASALLAIQLDELRRSENIRQEDVEGFSQESVSRLEKREDWKVSTLIEYLDALGFEMEIRIKKKSSRSKSIQLLKSG